MGIFGRLKDLDLKFDLLKESNDRLNRDVKYLKDKVSTLYEINDRLSFKLDNPDGLVYFSNICCCDGEIGYKFANEEKVVDLTLIDDASCLYKYKIHIMSDYVLKLSLIYREAGKKYKSNSSDMKEFIINTEDGTAVEVSNLDDDVAAGWIDVTNFD